MSGFAHVCKTVHGLQNQFAIWCNFTPPVGNQPALLTPR